jgi:hypothetical protein
VSSARRRRRSQAEAETAIRHLRETVAELEIQQQPIDDKDPGHLRRDGADRHGGRPARNGSRRAPRGPPAAKAGAVTESDCYVSRLAGEWFASGYRDVETWRED